MHLVPAALCAAHIRRCAFAVLRGTTPITLPLQPHRRLSAPRPPQTLRLHPQAPPTINNTNAPLSARHQPSPLTHPRPLRYTMGLPMWHVPSAEAKETKDTLKELSAPARSPIRRRSPRRARPASRSVRLFDNNDVRILDNDLVAAPRFTYAEPVSRSSSGRPRLPPPPVPESGNYARHRDAGRNGASPYPREVEESQRSTTYGSRLPTFGEIARSPRQLPALTPNFAPAAAARSSRRTNLPQGYDMPSDASDDDSNDNNAVGFPPLRRMGRRTIADGPLPSSSLRESWSPGTSVDGLGDRDRSVSPVDDHWDTMLSTVAPDPLAPTADSSFTSAAASASFSQSFSTSHPSSRAGSSNSNSAASSRTHLTVPSRRPSPPSEHLTPQCDSSDSDTASDTEDEDMDTTLRYLARDLAHQDPRTLRSMDMGLHLARSRETLRDTRARLARIRTSIRDSPPPQDPDRYPHAVHERSAMASRALQASRRRRRERRINGLGTQSAPRDTANWPPQVDGPVDGPADEPTASSFEDELQTLDQDLRDARAILERLIRRDDISDEVWASVGLPRPIADQLRERL